MRHRLWRLKCDPRDNFRLIGWETVVDLPEVLRGNYCCGIN